MTRKWLAPAFAASIVLFEVGRLLRRRWEASGEPWPYGSSWWVVSVLPMAALVFAAVKSGRGGDGGGG